MTHYPMLRWHTRRSEYMSGERINELKPRVSFIYRLSSTSENIACGAAGWARDVAAIAPKPELPALRSWWFGARRRATGGRGERLHCSGRGPRAAASFRPESVPGEPRRTPRGRGRKGPGVRGAARGWRRPCPAAGGDAAQLSTHRRFSSSKLRTSRGRRLSPSRFFFFLLRPITVRPGRCGSRSPKTLPV